MLIGEPTRFLISDDYEWVPKPDGPYVLLEHADYLELVGKLSECEIQRAGWEARYGMMQKERDELMCRLDEAQRKLKNYEPIALYDGKSIEQYAAELKAAESRLDTLVKAAEADIANAKAGCGGDGEGCEAFRGYYESAERRHRKCGQCPMDATQTTRAALSAIVVERQTPNGG